MGKTYIIEFQRREQYDCDGNCKARAIAKAFDENTTLSEIVKWVKQQAGLHWDDYNILTNPQILGITIEKGGNNEQNVTGNIDMIDTDALIAELESRGYIVKEEGEDNNE